MDLFQCSLGGFPKTHLAVSSLFFHPLFSIPTPLFCLLSAQTLLYLQVLLSYGLLEWGRGRLPPSSSFAFFIPKRETVKREGFMTLQAMLLMTRNTARLMLTDPGRVSLLYMFFYFKKMVSENWWSAVVRSDPFFLDVIFKRITLQISQMFHSVSHL